MLKLFSEAKVYKKFLVLIFMIVLISTFLYADTKTEEIYKQSKLFAKTVSIIQNSYVDDIKSEDLINSAINGMLGKLDEYTQILDADRFKEVEMETNGYFGGIGIRYERIKNKIVIVEVYSDTPAEKAGIIKKDEVYSINGEILSDGADYDKILSKIRGKIGTKVNICVNRFNEKTKKYDILKFDITREKIKMSTVISTVLKDNIGYIKIYEFTFATKDEFDKKYKELIDKGAKYLILDLRDNPGGVFYGAIDISKRFIGDKKLIVFTKGKNDSEVYNADEKAVFDYIPLVVLVNKNTASSSEIVAGAIKDNNRGILIGEQTFGKGCVQTLFELDNGKAVRLTTSKYYTPDGFCIDKKGIEPNFFVERAGDKDNILEFAVEIFNNSQILIEQK